jgi:Family of unknown function (DUF6062)
LLEKSITTIPILGAFERAKGCPLCLLWTETEKSSLERVEANELTMNPDFRAKIIAAAGFCNRHMHVLFEASFSGHTENGLGYALYMKDVLDTLESKIGGLNSNSHAEGFRRSSSSLLAKRSTSRRKAEVASRVANIIGGEVNCPICEMLGDSDRRTLTTFLKMLRERAFASLYARSKGICMPHFSSSLALLTKEGDRSDSVMTLLFHVQLEKLGSLRKLLDGRIRKYAWEHRDEALSAEEVASQLSALWMIAGAQGLYCLERKLSLSG